MNRNGPLGGSRPGSPGAEDAGLGVRARTGAGERPSPIAPRLALSRYLFPVQTNVLYYGDNLRILREDIPDASVDLIYLDPPFSSQRDYNLIFKDTTGTGEATAQIQAFEDTWHWGQEAEATLRYLTTTAEHSGRVPERVSTLMDALVRGTGRNDMTAYLVMMAPRLVEMHRVLKPTGSIYLHCDPTASHYLKLLMDAVFDPRNFRNEIIWKRANAHNDPRRFGRISDTLLYYGKTDRPSWNPQHTPYREEYYETHFKKDESGRYYRTVPLDAPRHGAGSPALIYEWKGKLPAPSRTWAVRREKMEEYENRGLIRYTKTGTPTLLQYADDMPGVPLQNIWTDIPPVNPQAKERLGYPTQKPLALLERIVLASSKIGDVVLDPFCGCGTAIVAAHKTGRRWIGIDITHLAIAVMRARLRDVFGIEKVAVIGEPVDLAGARALAAEETDGRYQFQWWALSLVDARRVGEEKKKGADRGIDGLITFAEQGGMKRVLVSVKSGHVTLDQVRALVGTVDRERAAMGIFITLEDATRPMRQEALSAGYYHSELWGKDFPKIQIATIRDLLMGKRPALPPSASAGFEKAERLRLHGGEQRQLIDAGGDEEAEEKD